MCTNFFAHLTGICLFFSTPTQRTEILDWIVNRRLPRCHKPGGTLILKYRRVNTVYECRKKTDQCHGRWYQATVYDLHGKQIHYML